MRGKRLYLSVSNSIHPWYEVRGEDWGPLAEFRVDRVAIQKDIIVKKLGEEELSGGEKRLI